VKKYNSTFDNVCSAEKLTKGSTVLLLRLVSFSAEQTLIHIKVPLICQSVMSIKIIKKSDFHHLIFVQFLSIPPCLQIWAVSKIQLEKVKFLIFLS
jgi:hypothetical protein